MTIKNATIEVFVGDWHLSEFYSGPADKCYVEALDWQNTIVLQYLAAHKITDLSETDKIINEAYNSITWEDAELEYYYALYYSDFIIGIYSSEADAQEAFLNECEEFATEQLNSGDSYDMFGRDFNYTQDFWFLVKDCAETLDIQVVPCYC